MFKRRKRVIRDAFVRAMRRHDKRQQAKLLSAARRAVWRDVYAKLYRRLEHRRDAALKGIPAVGSVLDLLGCPVTAYRVYLERRFKPGMTWFNWAYRGWHVDHIKSCEGFDLNNPEAQRACFHFSNTQPLWAKENWEKSKVGLRKK